ncbi:uncharacterized protein LOC143027157 isoform X2 [Oratosquilla oratoria]|uniref:uncharacterized protein LOC143027157 isoform X2 n=1 Tax=Oratosquilla oratoria TaxID=337810 RepID=UPI003F7591EA
MTSYRLFFLRGPIFPTLFAITFIISLPTRTSGHEGRHTYHTPLASALAKQTSKRHGSSDSFLKQASSQIQPMVQSSAPFIVDDVTSSTTNESPTIPSHLGENESTLHQNKRSIKNRYECEGTHSNSGYISPKEVVAETNSTFEVFCVLNPEESHNILFTVFKKRTFNNSIIVPRAILNDTVIRADIVDTSQDMYQLLCYSNDSYICNIHVTISDPPKNVENFRCLIYENTAMNCSWELPEYNVETSYDLSYDISFSSSGGRTLSWGTSMSCYEYEGFKGASWCYWDGRSSPSFSSVGPFLNFKFEVNSSLGSKSFKYEISRKDIVIPGPALDPNTVSLNSRALKVTWCIPSDIIHLKPFLQQIQLQYEGKQCTVGLYEESSNVSCPQTKFVEVPFGFTNYSVVVLLRVKPVGPPSTTLLQKDSPCSWPVNATTGSGVSPKPLPGDDLEDDLWWSVSRVTWDVTPPEVPQWSPAVDKGSFEVDMMGNVVLVWRSLDPRQFGGPDFEYCVVHLSDFSEEEPEPMCTTASWLNLTIQDPDSPQRFKVFSRNSEGSGARSSSIDVPPISQTPLAPTLAPVVKKLLKGDNYLYQLSIHAQDMATTDMTVYWCQDENLKGPCKSTLYWKHIGNVTSVDLTSSDLELNIEKNIRFAVSAQVQQTLQELKENLPDDAENSTYVEWSSGMVWSDYEVIPYLPLVDLQPPDVTLYSSNTNNLDVSWTLRLEDHGNIVRAFEVWYCDSNVTHPNNCTDGRPSNVTVDWWISQTRLRSLRENAVYTVWVRANHAEGPGTFSQSRTWRSAATQEPAMETWEIVLIASGSGMVLLIIIVVIGASGRVAWDCNKKSKIKLNIPQLLQNNTTKPASMDDQDNIHNVSTRTSLSVEGRHYLLSNGVGSRRTGDIVNSDYEVPYDFPPPNYMLVQEISSREARSDSLPGDCVIATPIEARSNSLPDNYVMASTEDPGWKRSRRHSLEASFNEDAIDEDGEERRNRRKMDRMRPDSFMVRTKGATTRKGQSRTVSNTDTVPRTRSTENSMTQVTSDYEPPFFIPPQKKYARLQTPFSIDSGTSVTRSSGKARSNSSSEDYMADGTHTSTDVTDEDGEERGNHRKTNRMRPDSSLVGAKVAATRKGASTPRDARMPVSRISHQDGTTTLQGFVWYHSFLSEDKAANVLKDTGKHGRAEVPTRNDSGQRVPIVSQGYVHHESFPPGYDEGVPDSTDSELRAPIMSQVYIQHGSFAPGDGEGRSSNTNVNEDQSSLTVPVIAANALEDSGKPGRSEVPAGTDSELRAPMISRGYIQHGPFAPGDGEGRSSTTNVNEDQSSLTVPVIAANALEDSGKPGRSGVPASTDSELHALMISQGYVQHGSFAPGVGEGRSSTTNVNEDQSSLTVPVIAANALEDSGKPGRSGVPAGTDSELRAPMISRGYIQHGSFAPGDGEGRSSTTNVNEDQSSLTVPVIAANALEDSGKPGRSGVPAVTDSEPRAPMISRGYIQHGSFAPGVGEGQSSTTNVNEDQSSLTVPVIAANALEDSGKPGRSGVPAGTDSELRGPMISQGYVQHGSFAPGDGEGRSSTTNVNEDQISLTVPVITANALEDSGKFVRSGIPVNKYTEECAPLVSHGFVQHESFAAREGDENISSVNGECHDESDDHSSIDQSLIVVPETADNAMGDSGRPRGAESPVGADSEKCPPIIPHGYIQHGSFAQGGGKTGSINGNIEFANEIPGLVSQHQNVLTVPGTVDNAVGDSGRPGELAATTSKDSEHGYAQHEVLAPIDGGRRDATAGMEIPKGGHVSQDQSFLAVPDTADNDMESSGTPIEEETLSSTDSEPCVPAVSRGYVQSRESRPGDRAREDSIVLADFPRRNNGYVTPDQGFVSVVETDAVRRKDSNTPRNVSVPDHANSTQNAPDIPHGYVQHGLFNPDDVTTSTVTMEEHYL